MFNPVFLSCPIPHKAFTVLFCPAQNWASTTVKQFFFYPVRLEDDGYAFYLVFLTIIAPQCSCSFVLNTWGNKTFWSSTFICENVSQFLIIIHF